MLSNAFSRLLVYRAGTTLSYQILAVTAGWHIYSITHDVLSLGLLGLAEVLPYFCSSLFAGHAVDVLSKRLLALAGCACHLLIAIVMVLVDSELAVAWASGRSSRIECVMRGAVMMKITRSTSITSTSGVVLISDIGCCVPRCSKPPNAMVSGASGQLPTRCVGASCE